MHSDVTASIAFLLHLIGSVVYLTVILMLLQGASSALIAYLRSFYYTPVAFARTRSQGYKTVFMLNLAELKISDAHNY